MREEPWPHSTHTPCISGTHRVLLYGRVCWSCVFSHETARAATRGKQLKGSGNQHMGTAPHLVQDVFTGVKSVNTL